MAVNKPDLHSENQVGAPELERPVLHHEESDVNVWAIGKFGIVLMLGCIAALALVVGVFKYFQTREKAEPVVAMAPNADARNLPPEPRLQPAETADMQQMRAAEDQILNGYGWVDREHGVVRVPISIAIDMLAARGLPTRTDAPAARDAATVPTESGLGPVMNQPGGPLGNR